MTDDEMRYWGGLDVWSVGEFEQLCCGLCPTWFPPNSTELSEARERIRRGFVAGNLIAVETHDRLEHGSIFKDEYVASRHAIEWAQPRFPLFPLFEKFDQCRLDRSRATAWPWGNHETALLRDLADAAKKWWTNYDPSDPTTAPTNDAVAAWLRNERKVGKTVAESMAQILRADGLKPGPRR